MRVAHSRNPLAVGHVRDMHRLICIEIALAMLAYLVGFARILPTAQTAAHSTSLTTLLLTLVLALVTVLVPLVSVCRHVAEHQRNGDVLVITAKVHYEYKALIERTHAPWDNDVLFVRQQSYAALTRELDADFWLVYRTIQNGDQALNVVV